MTYIIEVKKNTSDQIGLQFTYMYLHRDFKLYGILFFGRYT